MTPSARRIQPGVRHVAIRAEHEVTAPQGPSGRVSAELEIRRIDFVAIPSRDAARSKAFYGETLGLRPDDHRGLEFWAADTCLNIWEPARFGVEFRPQKGAHLAFQVDDVEQARKELEARGVAFEGDTVDTGVCLMASFTDPDGNDLMLHHRYAAYD